DGQKTLKSIETGSGGVAIFETTASSGLKEGDPIFFQDLQNPQGVANYPALYYVGKSLSGNRTVFSLRDAAGADINGLVSAAGGLVVPAAPYLQTLTLDNPVGITIDPRTNVSTVQVVEDTLPEVGQLFYFQDLEPLNGQPL